MQKIKTWQADLGNGIYRNPILFADYSDPDAIRVGDTYYMTASSFNFTPGLPILVSKDLVNWELKNYAVKNLPGEVYSMPQHSKGVWAPSIRFHEGYFYIYYGMPDEGIYMVRAKDALGEWEEPVLVLPGKGLIDPCPVWDEDGRAYVIHAYAKSRIGFKSFLGIFEMSWDGSRALSEDHFIFDGTRTQVTIEGPKVYKRNGWYYIFAPAGGVKTGWQTVLRSRCVYGPYEEKIVMRQGDSPVNGPHQGALVDTPDGEEWFLHFQDRGAFGRIVHLQPARWKDGWCIIGREKDGRDWGEPYLFHKKPNLPPAPVCTLEASDSFEGERLNLMWQWLGNHREDFYSLTERPGCLRLFAKNETGRTPAVLWNSANVLTQKIVCPDMEMRTRVDVSGLKQSGRAGILVIGGGYAALELLRGESGALTVRYLISQEKESPAREQVLREWNVSGDAQSFTLGVQITVEEQEGSPRPVSEEKDYRPARVRASFFFETGEGEHISAGETYELSPHTWVGAKTGLYAVCDESEDCGWADFFGVDCDPKPEKTRPEFQLAESGDLEAMRYMVEYSKTSMNERDEMGKTFLHYAARSGNTELVRYLVERVGLSCTDGDRNLITPFEEARLAGQEETEAYFAQCAGAPLEHMYKNPIRTGMYPDPSIVRVGEDYYMVNSSFVYFPCIPVSHSRDLVNWEIIGYAVTDSEWANLGELEGGRGFWAPDISYSNGRFYITASWRLNDDGTVLRRQMIVSSEKPEGPYSKPVFIDEEGIDPSLFHDDDGRHYMLLNRGARILELNKDLTEQISEARLLWYGDQKRAPEGPHLLKKDGYYYLILAEGGTGPGHRITLARSRSLEEPFEPCPYDPIMRQNDPEALIQRCGHGKPVSTPDGRWFIPYLCGRMPDGKHTFLGRETALDEMEWTADGWAIINRGRGPSVLAKMPFAGTVQKRSCEDTWTEDIAGGRMSLEWMSPRGRRESEIEETEQGVRMKGDLWDLDSLNARNALLRRQTAFAFEAQAELEILSLDDGGEADFVCYYDERTWIKFGVARTADAYCCFMEENRGDEKRRTFAGELKNITGSVTMICRGDGVCREFILEAAEAEPVRALAEDASYLCDEGYSYGKRFTGPTMGIYALGKETELMIESFRYRAKEDAAVLR